MFMSGQLLYCMLHAANISQEKYNRSGSYCNTEIFLGKLFSVYVPWFVLFALNYQNKKNSYVLFTTSSVPKLEIHFPF